MKKINWEDVVTLSCFVLLYIIGYWSGCSQAYDKGYKEGYHDYHEHFKAQMDTVQSYVDSALYYKHYYYNQCQGLTPEPINK